MFDLTPLEAAEKLEEDKDDYLCSRCAYQGLIDCKGTCRATAPYDVAISYLRKIASGEYAPVVHAYWKEVEPGHDVLFECSNCGRIISTSWGSCEDEDTNGNNGCDPTDEWLSCPTCNAIMDESDMNQTQAGKDDFHA
jgi:hypothetical protein